MKHAVELHKRRIPLRLLLIDALGALLAAAGVLELIETGPRILPAALRFPGVGIVLVVIGIIVMMAVPVWLIRRHREEHQRRGEAS